MLALPGGMPVFDELSATLHWFKECNNPVLIPEFTGVATTDADQRRHVALKKP